MIVYASGHTIRFTVLGFHRFFKSATAFHRAWQPKWPMLGQFLRLGWPKSLEFLMVSALFSVTSLLVGRLGVQAIAAHTIAFEISIVVFVGAVAVADAVTTRIGIASIQEGHAGVWP